MWVLGSPDQFPNDVDNQLRQKSEITMATTHSIALLFSALPAPLVKNLDKSYTEIKTNFTQRRYEPSELNGGKFCEIILRILEWHTSPSKSFTAFGSKIRDFGQATRKFESLTSFPDSVRFHIPKILNSLYDIRNKRGVGHVGGDVDPNHMDALFVVSAADWILAELVRLFHNISVNEADAIVEALISKKVSVVWEVAGKKRILDPRLKYPERTLLLLYDSYPKALRDDTLCEWTEYTNPAIYRTKLLKPLHKKKLIEYDINSGDVHISPTGLRQVEEKIPLEF